MSAQIIQLDPHDKMSVDDCVSYISRNKEDYSDILVVGYDMDGDLVIRSSHMSVADACFMLMKAIDYTKGS